MGRELAFDIENLRTKTLKGIAREDLSSLASEIVFQDKISAAYEARSSISAGYSPVKHAPQ